MTWRVRSRATFAALHRHGVRLRRGPLTLVYLADDVIEPPRFAYAVNRRVGNAVRRNRLRRRIRAAVAAAVSDGDPFPAPGAYLFSATPAAMDLSWKDLRSGVAALMYRVDDHTTTTAVPR